MVLYFKIMLAKKVPRSLDTMYSPIR